MPFVQFKTVSGQSQGDSSAGTLEGTKGKCLKDALKDKKDTTGRIKPIIPLKLAFIED